MSLTIILKYIAVAVENPKTKTECGCNRIFKWRLRCRDCIHRTDGMWSPKGADRGRIDITKTLPSGWLRCFRRNHL